MAYMSNKSKWAVQVTNCQEDVMSLKSTHSLAGHIALEVVSWLIVLVVLLGLLLAKMFRYI